MDNTRLKIFRDTIEHEYDSKRFLRFIIELINGVKVIAPDKNISAGEMFPNIKHYNYIGKYSDSNGDEVALFSVCVKGSLEARTMQRNFVRTLLDNSDIDGALAAFYSDGDNEKWRLSFVRLVKSIGELNMKITPAKRYSYLVGKGEPSHTAQKRLFPIFEDERSTPTLDDLQEAFKVEPVTEEFYKLYESKYFDLKEYLDSNSDFTLNSEHFAKKLLGQIAFLYFLQKKGWLGVNKHSSWGTGQRDFIRQIFTQCMNERKNFFHDYLEPLFYNALNNDRGNDSYFPDLDCRIPFLNGGLFEAKYNWRDKSCTIDNEFFSGLLDLFDRYNFTISEDEPFESEIAIDPEMLGKVFENLLDRPERKQKGAFYTPREIVNYMCRECLIDYLTSKTKISDSEIRKFITFGDILTRNEIDSRILERIDEIDELLRRVRVVDMAAGSGAFLLGILNGIVHARNIITSFTSCNHERNYYTLKHDTIRDSIFACDIEPAAVDIAKLRLWLSLVIDDNLDNDNPDSRPRPLPNLDCNIICADSLLESFMGIKLTSENKGEGNIFGSTLDDRAMLQESRQLHRKLYDESNMNKKIALRERLQNIHDAIITRQIHLNQNTETQNIIDSYNRVKNADSKPFLLWELNFPEVFIEGDNHGFDIVIGNPPYIDSENMTRNMKYRRDAYKKEFTCAQGNWDLFVLFIEKGIKLLRSNGIMSFIVSNKLISAPYAASVRKLMSENQLIEIRDYSSVNVFKRAAVYPVVFRLRRPEIKSLVRLAVMNDMENVESTHLVDSGKFYFINNWDRYFHTSQTALGIIDKMNAFTQLEDLMTVNGAATVGEAYLVKEFLFDGTGNEKGTLKFINTGGIDPYKSLHGQSPIQYLKARYKYPLVLIDDLKAMSERRLQESQSEKIIVAGMTKILECYYDTGEYLAGKSTTIVHGGKHLKYIIALLNSKLMTYYYQNCFNSMSLAGGFFRVGVPQIKKLPIVLPKNNSVIRSIEKLVDQIIELKSRNIDSHEIDSQIDRMVYDLYGLSESEIAIIEAE